MVSLFKYHTNATSKRWHLWEIDLRFALDSTPGWTLFPELHGLVGPEAAAGLAAAAAGNARTKKPK